LPARIRAPVHYATYVKIYNVTPQTVTVGYTYGYMGTVVSADGVVVYGTGYYYTPYIGPTAWVPVPVTGGYASGQRGATYNPNTGVAARGGSATVGNAYTGSQNTAKWGQVSGPGGQSASAAKVGNNVYAGHDGNVYKNTGSGWEQKTGGECYPFFSKIWNHYPGKRD